MLVSNEWEQFRIETLATKEPETIEWILDRFRPGDILFDIGANIGIYAVLAAALNPKGLVVAVEPMAATFARLCENALINELDNLRPYCLAVSATNGVGTLKLASTYAGSSMHSLERSSMTEKFGEAVVLQTGVGFVTLDSLAAIAGMPSLVKIDVDGAEDDVLAGAGMVLHDDRLRSLLVEFNRVRGSRLPKRRDAPLLHAGFIARHAGADTNAAR